MPLDLLLKNCRKRDSDSLEDIGIEGGRIAAPPAAGADAEATRTIDLEGALVLPAFVEPHVHLDAVLTVGQPRYNESGSLFEGIAIWAERVRDLSLEDVKERVRQVLRWQLANGVLHVRSHVDVCDPELRAVRALTELREEVRGQMEIQLVAFPQQGIYSFDGGETLMRRAVEMGVDVVGGIPHFELTREYGERSVHFSMELAAEHGLLVDIHCDETDDSESRFLEVMVADTIRLGLEGRVTASHTTAMHSYNNAYAGRLVQNVKRAGLNMVTNPLDNSVLQGRFDSYPIRRGHTRVKELLAAGINVCIGNDSVMDPWYPLGCADPLQAAFVMVHFGQMSGRDQMRTLFDMITFNPAGALRLEGYGLEAGDHADLVVVDAPSELDALRLVSPRRYVIRRGEIVARSERRASTVTWNGREERVDFLRHEPGP